MRKRKQRQTTSPEISIWDRLKPVSVALNIVFTLVKIGEWIWTHCFP